MTAPSSIDPGFLHDQLATASPDLLRAMLTTFINTLMSAEADAVCGAAYGRPSPERVNIRNGYRHREFDTRAGTLDVAIPKLRSGSYFRAGCSSAAAAPNAPDYRGRDLLPARGLDPADGEAGRVVGHHPAVQVAGLHDGRRADAQVADFRSRPLDQGPYTFVAADALVLKVREGRRVVNVHALLATGVNGDGHREILGLQVTSARTAPAGWASSVI